MLAVAYDLHAQQFMLGASFKVDCWEVLEMIMKDLQPRDLMNFAETSRGALAIVSTVMESQPFVQRLLSSIVKKYLECSTYHRSNWHEHGGLLKFLQEELVEIETIGGYFRKVNSLLCEFEKVAAVERFMDLVISTADEELMKQATAYYDQHGDSPTEWPGAVIAVSQDVLPPLPDNERNARMETLNGVLKDPFMSLILGHLWAAACANLSVDSKVMVIDHMIMDLKVRDQLKSYLEKRKQFLSTNMVPLLEDVDGLNQQWNTMMGEESNLRILLRHFFGVYNALTAPVAAVGTHRIFLFEDEASTDAESSDDDEADDSTDDEDSSSSNGNADESIPVSVPESVVPVPFDWRAAKAPEEEEEDSFDPNVPLQKAFKRRLFGAIALELLMKGLDAQEQAVTMMLLAGPVATHTSEDHQKFLSTMISIQQRVVGQHLNVFLAARKRELESLENFTAKYQCGVDYPCSPLKVVAQTIRPVDWTAQGARRVLMDGSIRGLAGRSQSYGRPDIFQLTRMLATRFAFFASEYAPACLGLNLEDEKKVFEEAVLFLSKDGAGRYKFHAHNFGALIRNSGKAALEAIVRRMVLDCPDGDLKSNIISVFLGSVVYAEVLVKGDGSSALRVFKKTALRTIVNAHGDGVAVDVCWDALTLNTTNALMLHMKLLMGCLTDEGAVMNLNDIDLREHAMRTIQVDSARTARTLASLSKFVLVEKTKKCQQRAHQLNVNAGNTDRQDNARPDEEDIYEE